MQEHTASQARIFCYSYTDIVMNIKRCLSTIMCWRLANRNTSQETHSDSITKHQYNAVCCVNHTEHTNKLYGETAEMFHIISRCKVIT
jgi:hypothetical protein